jgi:hypothetical protein
MNRFYKFLGYSILSLIVSVSGYTQTRSGITSAELRKHVGYLASQELKGRYPGTPGDLAAASYIRDCFKEYGLKTFTTDGFQTFRVTTGIAKGSTNKLAINGIVANPDQDFMPLSISDNGTVSGTLAFVGYGFSVDTDSLKWDDYAGLNLKGKIAVVLLGAPEPEAGVAMDPFESHGSVRSKLLLARDAGATGVILVAGPAYDPKDELEFGTNKENSAGLPVIRVKRSYLNQFSEAFGMTMENAEKQLNVNHKPLSRLVNLSVNLTTDLITTTSETRNIVAYLPAVNAKNAGDWVVVGAHYDHLGTGGAGSSSRIQDTVGVHPGADDNASGVAAIIEMAGNLAAKQSELDRSVLFVAFTGEEMGLLGSKYFVANPPIPIGSISAMFNLDMVGRPNEERRISISGTGTEMDSILSLIKPGKLTWSRSPEGYGPSDHASFYSAGIPVFYFSTGAHLDYHTPADTPDKLDYEVMKILSDQISDMILSVAEAPSKLTFREAGPKATDSGRRKLKVTLGIMPDVSGTENNGLRVEFATPGKPAALAGIEKGDRITSINGLPVTNVYDYMSRLQSLKAGQTASVELTRGEKKIVVLVQL